MTIPQKIPIWLVLRYWSMSLGLAFLGERVKGKLPQPKISEDNDRNLKFDKDIEWFMVYVVSKVIHIRAQFPKNYFPIQPAIICSKLTIEIIEQGVEYVQS